MNRNSNIETKPGFSRDFLKLILYWSVALIPLAWGIVMTIKKALALF